MREVAKLSDGRTVWRCVEEMTCPFCGETDFDATGLKIHLLDGHCAEFDNTPNRELLPHTKDVTRKDV